jgi:hypothetical protein
VYRGRLCMTVAAGLPARRLLGHQPLLKGARAKMTASPIEDGCWSTTSSRRGSPRPAMKRCICCGSVMVISLQERAMNRFVDSSTEPERRSIAISSRGESVSGGSKRAFTTCVNCV